MEEVENIGLKKGLPQVLEVGTGRCSSKKCTSLSIFYYSVKNLFRVISVVMNSI